MVLTRLQKRKAFRTPDSRTLPAKRQRLCGNKTPAPPPSHAHTPSLKATSRKGARRSEIGEEWKSAQLQPKTAKTEGKLTISPRRPESFGLIQERLPSSDTPGTPEHIYSLVIQSILWNQTRGHSALPVLEAILAKYPSPSTLSEAQESGLQELLQPIGLWRQRAKRLIQVGQIWGDKPPSADRRYVKRGYKGPLQKDGTYDPAGWEIAHLPGVGAYALDAFRIFARDGLRAKERCSGDIDEAEWKTVLPSDKDLRAFLKWRWARDGWDWDQVTGSRTRLST